jgi:hypothetical protein
MITLPQTLREELERDLENNTTTSVETSPTRNMASLAYTPKEIQQRWNPEIAAKGESENNTINKEASVAKPENESTPD